MIFPSSFKITSKRIFLFRRKLDGVIFGLGAFMLMLPTETSAIIFGIFVVMGLYLLALRPAKSLRHLDKKYALATLIFATACLAINLLNGSLPEDLRWSSYPLYYLMIVPLAVGAVLVRDPLRQFVLGARAGLVVITLWGLATVAAEGGRFGLGSNAANAAFALAFLAVFSRLDVKSPPALLANRRVFFYLALIAILASQTRAVLPVFLVGMAVDLFSLVRSLMAGRRPTFKQNAVTWIALLSICAGSLWVLYPIVSQRIHATTNEIATSIEHPETGNASGLSTRLVQWRAALGLIAENPLLGRGGYGISEAVANHAAATNQEHLLQYTFVHNFILDEAIQRGLAGLAITLCFFGFCFFRIYTRGDASMKENVFLLLTLTFSFGMLHYLLVIDRHVVLYALYFLLLTTANHGWRPPYRQQA